MASPLDARRPLCGRRILVTRPMLAALAQRDRFLALGADAVVLPCLKLEGPQDPEAFARLVAAVDQYDGVILSSPAGVDAFVQGLSRLGVRVDCLAGRTVVAVGRATASACAAAGFVPDVVPARPRLEGIIEALAGDSALGQRWMHVRARDGRDTLGDAISAAGGHYQLAVGYRAERPSAPPGAIEWVCAGVDAICLHSGRTGQHLRQILTEAVPDLSEEILRTTSIVSAGPVTTKALREMGLEVAATAVSPGDDGMLRAVLDLLGSKPAS